MLPGTGFEWVECPRDAMQGVVQFIPTQQKINYLNSLLKVGFNVLDFGSFVSEKAIPQLRDTAEVLENLDESGDTRLLAIVANRRGA
ncbi:MAG: hydroxymethylglutaryl-CoA lyase, partial [Bacteroidota bacterium]